MTKETLSLTPEKAFCPNSDCPARGRVAAGNIGVHSQKERRFICHVCEWTFSATKGTVFYRRQKALDVMVCVITLLAHGCPIQAIVAAFGLDRATMRGWLDASGTHCQAVHEQLVERPRPLGQVQADELRVKAMGVILWVGMALQVQTRLWLGVEVSAHRDSALIERLIKRVNRAARALGGPLLFCTDGLASYPTQLKAVFRAKEPRREKGRCRLVEWPNLMIAQVVKEYAGKCMSGSRRQIVQGDPDAIAAVIKETQGAGGINTAFLERLNGTTEPGTAHAGARTQRRTVGGGRLFGRDGVQLLYGARKPATAGTHRRSQMVGTHTGHGERPDRALLECQRTVELPRPAPALATAKVPGTTLQGAQSFNCEVGLMSTIACIPTYCEHRLVKLGNKRNLSSFVKGHSPNSTSSRNPSVTGEEPLFVVAAEFDESQSLGFCTHN